MAKTRCNHMLDAHTMLFPTRKIHRVKKPLQPDFGMSTELSMHVRKGEGNIQRDAVGTAY